MLQQTTVQLLAKGASRRTHCSTPGIWDAGAPGAAGTLCGKVNPG